MFSTYFAAMVNLAPYQDQVPENRIRFLFDFCFLYFL